MLRTTLSYLLLVATLAFAAYAVDPVSPPPEDQETPRTHQEQQMLDAAQAQPGTTPPFPRQFIVGKVTGAGGTPMGGTGVKLFADGELVAWDQTNPSGDFELDLPLHMETDQSVVLWFVPSTDRYVMQAVVVKKSEVARMNGLFGPCAIEVDMQPQMRVDISLLTGDELVESIKARGCY
jgi:hypothetical protein